MDELKNALPLEEEQLKDAAGGIKLGPGTGGSYKCPQCGHDDFVINSVSGNDVFVTCKRCGKMCKCSRIQ